MSTEAAGTRSVDVNLFWHRRDCRTVDNAGLAAAAADGPTLPVYVRDPVLHDRFGPPQRAFVHRSLRRLRDRYRDRGSDLVVRTGPVPDALDAVADAYGAEAVHTNQRYTPADREAEAAVADRLPLERHHDATLVDPGELDARYPSYSKFADDWNGVATTRPTVHDEPDADGLVTVRDDDRSDGAIPGIDPGADIPPAGQRAARERFDAFCEAAIHDYADTRDDLADEGVSRLSAHLASGCVGPRTLFRRVDALRAAAEGDAERGVAKYRDELRWREFFYHVLYHNSETVHENYRSLPNAIAWRDDPDALDAWKRGETGFPLVDAGMRQLLTEGYVHNRARQNVASFLTKHLLIDWREGADWFRERLVDHDHASNYGGWQWAASTGTDSVDVRIFNPVSQAERYDPDAEYIRRYVPELRGVDTETVHAWPDLSSADRDRVEANYPAPIVDYDARYREAKQVFEAALGKR